MSQVTLRIVVTGPPAGVDYGLQKGRGTNYETLQRQHSGGADLSFEFTVGVKVQDGESDFTGPFVQGPRGQRFVYVDIGTSAGQMNSQWSRRLKVPLTGIEPNAVAPGAVLEARLPGTGKDGTPACATPKPFNGWVRV